MMPFVLEPIFKERIWGASELPAPYPQPEPGKPIGEVWLTALECTIAEGESAGTTLGELMPEFPLLMKVLLPKEKLSVQVHPNDAEAQRINEARGKTECWYVMQADAGAEVALGLKPGVRVEDLRAAIAEGRAEDKLQMVPVKAGDLVFVDAGTIHAIGPGMVVLETQQYSDVTYRLYDYGRPRELHLEAGLAVSKTGTEAGLTKPVEHPTYTRLVECEYFAVDELKLDTHGETKLEFSDKLQILVALDEGASLRSQEGDVQMHLPKGKAVVLPAGASYAVLAHSGGKVMRVLAP
ncbi:type I phosphomannose isomerase catalytic subunit [Granulicella cerasi]|uniref:Type I phosphomannose isomerase catalytic subunit n=1 Tax=Granulicella cerasi TaxID=741063 RepID=A0ABW1Z7W2_9BACT|nr:type I phosphomannose isomerase catalytic subunit [Granulicella cerasi]